MEQPDAEVWGSSWPGCNRRITHIRKSANLSVTSEEKNRSDPQINGVIAMTSWSDVYFPSHTGRDHIVTFFRTKSTLYYWITSMYLAVILWGHELSCPKPRVPNLCSMLNSGCQSRCEGSKWNQARRKALHPPGGAQEPQDQTEDEEGLQHKGRSLCLQWTVSISCAKVKRKNKREEMVNRSLDRKPATKVLLNLLQLSASGYFRYAIQVLQSGGEDTGLINWHTVCISVHYRICFYLLTRCDTAFVAQVNAQVTDMWREDYSLFSKS